MAVVSVEDDLALGAEPDPRVRYRKVLVARFIVVAVFLAIWQVTVEVGLVDAFWISSPKLVAEELWSELASGALDPYRHARASIQLGSTLRHLGRLEESEQLLLAQLERCRIEGAGAALHDEVRAVLAFTWIAQGRTLEAAALALETLAPHLSRYNRSMAANARALLGSSGG